jgi:SpoVK/Ycf46/Vps4 family AAA+-type ATPase
MEILVNAEVLKKLVEKSVIKSSVVKEKLDYYSHSEMIEFEIAELSEKEIIELEKEVKAYREAHPEFERKLKKTIRKIKNFKLMKADPESFAPKRLDVIPNAFKEFLKSLPNKWLFREDKDGNLLPYYFVDSEFCKGTKHSVARTRISLVSTSQVGKDYSHNFYASDLIKGMTIASMLEKLGFILETEELVKNYWEEIERYKEIQQKTGFQFLASGTGYIKDSWYRSETSMEREGNASKVVMDNFVSEDRDGDEKIVDGIKLGTASSDFWKEKEDEDNTDDSGEDEENKNMVTAPLHPFLKVFDLEKHDYVHVHVNNLEEYKYDKELIHKLVLSSQKKELIDILLHGAKDLMEDIVKGKTGGVIVMATGFPGTGKTLTAEVYSEAIEKPLYVVQSSQLGTRNDGLEKTLHTILTRSSRWGAILLIDEADVYIHERGEDIEQNAIVGIFLRLLEYYRGVLFLTSNRSTIIDDAIMSRVTAHIHYSLPAEDERTEIWKIIGKQYEMKIENNFAKELSKNFEKASGRNIRNMIKLAAMICKRKKKTADLKLFEYISQFIDWKNENGKE